MMFQSSADPKAGCQDLRLQVRQRAVQVSILSRPEGRLPIDLLAQVEAITGFQSSADPKAGCHTYPSPASGPSIRVSILSRPEGRLPSAAMPRGGRGAT